MIIIRLNELIQKEERPVKWVSNKTGIAYSTIIKLNNNETSSISFDVIDKLCKLFKCEVQELIEFKDDSEPIKKRRPIRLIEYSRGE